MSSRINEIRRKISALRSKMLAERDAVRDQIKHDLDCAESSLRLLAMRADLSALVQEWKAAGGSERLPAVRERLKKNDRAVQQAEPAPMQKVQKPLSARA